MKDMQACMEKLRVQTAECELIRDLATDKAKRQLFSRLAEHFKVLAGHIEIRHGSAAEHASRRQDLRGLP
jgi:hypothetical protein